MWASIKHVSLMVPRVQLTVILALCFILFRLHLFFYHVTISPSRREAEDLAWNLARS